MKIILYMVGIILLAVSTNGDASELVNSNDAHNAVSELRDDLQSYSQRIETFSQPRLFAEWVKASSVTFASCGFAVSTDTVQHFISMVPVASVFHPAFQRWLGFENDSRWGRVLGLPKALLDDLGGMLTEMPSYESFLNFHEHIKRQLETSSALYGKDGLCRRQLSFLYVLGDEISSRPR